LKLRVRRRRLPASTLVATLTGAILLSMACGKKGPPMPPLRRGPDRMASVSARQEGKGVVLTGLLPQHSQDGGPLAPIVEVRIWRLDRGGLTGLSGGQAKTAERNAVRQFTKDAKRIATVEGEALRKALSGRRFAFLDPDPLGGEIPQAGKDLTYALTAVDIEKRSSTVSNFAALRLLPPPMPPANLQAEVSEKAIRLFWEPPAPQAQEVSVQYNVYRSETEGLFLDPPRNAQPLAQPAFEDTEFSFGKEYFYSVRSVAVSGKASRESEGSASLKLSAKDVYAPVAPTGFAVSAEGNVIKLYWFPNSETDLAGYRIYRSTSETEGFTELARPAAADSTYVDAAVEAGVKYYYSITAVDTAEPPNESERSEVRTDRIAPQAPGGGKPPPGKP
jgi:hypothetical protein